MICIFIKLGLLYKNTNYFYPFSNNTNRGIDLSLKSLLLQIVLCVALVASMQGAENYIKSFLYNKYTVSLIAVTVGINNIYNLYTIYQNIVIIGMCEHKCAKTVEVIFKNKENTVVDQYKINVPSKLRYAAASACNVLSIALVIGILAKQWKS